MTTHDETKLPTVNKNIICANTFKDANSVNMLHFTGSINVPDQVFFKLAVTAQSCMNDRAPLHLSNYCVPVASAGSEFCQQSPICSSKYLALTAVGLFQLPAPWAEVAYFDQDPVINADFFRCLLKIYLFTHSAW